MRERERERDELCGDQMRSPLDHLRKGRLNAERFTNRFLSNCFFWKDPLAFDSAANLPFRFVRLFSICNSKIYRQLVSKRRTLLTESPPHSRSCVNISALTADSSLTFDLYLWEAFFWIAGYIGKGSGDLVGFSRIVVWPVQRGLARPCVHLIIRLVSYEREKKKRFAIVRQIVLVTLLPSIRISAGPAFV